MKFLSADKRLEGEGLKEQVCLAELYLLDVFVEICKEYNLKYFLDSGTLLGAVRHQGFIPWDDDIDVGMPVDDFKRFLAIAPQVLPRSIMVEQPSFFWGRPESFAKLRDRASFFCEKTTNVQSPCGIYIDIFPFEQYPQSPRWLVRRLTRCASSANASFKVYLSAVYHSPMGLLIAAMKSAIWKFILRACIVGMRLLRRASRTKWRYCAGIGFAEQFGIDDHDMFPLSQVVFCGKEYSAPHNSDAMLRAYYGDWRTLPPPEKRQWHASIICPTQAPDAPWARPYVATNGG